MPTGRLGLRNHLVVRDYLRSHPDTAQQYGALKMELASEFADDIDGYTDAKTEFMLDILRRTDLSENELRDIEESNRS